MKYCFKLYGFILYTEIVTCVPVLTKILVIHFSKCLFLHVIKLKLMLREN